MSPAGGALRRYAHWLHTCWPAGTVERLPEMRADGSTAVTGLYVAGDLTGIPLLKFALESGARVAHTIASDPALRRAAAAPGTLDLVIVGAGVSGMAGAVEARRLGLSFEVLESSEPFATLVNFPVRKPIYAYPRALRPASELQVSADVKEDLVAELRAQMAAAGIRPRAAVAERIERVRGMLRVRLEGGGALDARRVLVAVGRSGRFRRLGVPGEDREGVLNRLHDPMDYAGCRVLVVGGGDTAVETAIALVLAGADVTLAHRDATLSRPRPENLENLERLRRDPNAAVEIEHPSDEQVTTAAGGFMGRRGEGRLTVRPETRVREILPAAVVLEDPRGATETIANDVVFPMIGRDPPLELLGRSGVRFGGEWTAGRVLALVAFMLFCVWLYDWKSGGFFAAVWQAKGWFPTDLAARLAAWGDGVAVAARDRRTLLGTLAISAASPSFYYTIAYSIVIVAFGLRRIRRRRTPYVTAQTVTFTLIQVIPLFLLPEILLPLLDANGLLPRPLADALFPQVAYGHGREFWRAYGLILAWPLNVYNVFTPEPLPWWLAISVVQTLVLIPLGVWFFGKGVYCGWICSCGGLAETLGDDQRHKMPHGPGWNRLNLAGQGVLAVAVLLLLVRIAGWVLPDGNWFARGFDSVLQPGYKWTIDVFLAGVIGYGTYFWLSGRVWCRFFCPLAALMHVFARFSRFRILSDKKKCISCGQCTRFCHQGIDVMSFANKGIPLADPQCVRCSACVHVCPTGVLSFGRVDASGAIVSLDSLLASPVQMREGVNGAAREKREAAGTREH